MNKTSLLLISAVVFLALISGLPQTSQAQHYWMNPTEGNQLSLEILKSNFDSQVDGIGFATSSWYFSGQYYFNEKIAFVYELPISNYSPENETIYDQGETAVGNLYLGLKYNELDSKSNKFIGHFGLRLPFAPDGSSDALGIGAYSSFDRLEAFMRDYFTLSFAGTYVVRTSETLDLNFSLGGDFMIATEDNRDSESFLNYNFYLNNTFENVILGAGFTGRALVSDDGDFGEISVHQLGLSGFYNGERFKPGIIIRLPIDEDVNDIIDMAFSFKLIYSLY